jgi:hypothetical protein
MMDFPMLGAVTSSWRPPESERTRVQDLRSASMSKQPTGGRSLRCPIPWSLAIGPRVMNRMLVRGWTGKTIGLEER